MLDVLALVHGESVRPGIFGEVARARGDRLTEWSLAWGRPLPRERFDALMVFGGAMHPDQDAAHPWLAEELELLRETELPTLGVCLGAQLLARAFGGRVFEAPQPEIGWYDVERLDERDPVLGTLPERFVAYQYHYYSYEVPAGAVELARSERCTQAFRLGDRWAVQFHPEVTRRHVEEWAREEELAVPDGTDAHLPRWQELGAALCGAFLDYSAGRSGRLDQSCQEPA